MGNEITACRQCKTVTSSIRNGNQQPKFNTIDYKITENYLEKGRNIPSQILNYNKDYQELIADLRGNNLRFEDTYFPPNDGSLGFRLIQQIPITKWKRIGELFPGKRISEKIQTFQQSNLQRVEASKQRNYNIHLALLEMSKHSELISRAIPSPIIIKQGIFIVYLCLNGQCRNPVQVVIDDLIPVDTSNNYIYRQKEQTIWMLVLQKALAKILGNYERLNKLQTTQFFEEIVGVPVYSPTLYQPSFHIESSSLSLIGQQSVYYKFTLNNKSKMHLSIWQPRRALFGNDFSYVQLVAELALETQKEPQRLVYISELQDNKLIITNSVYQQVLDLEAGKYFIHIYGRFSKLISRRLNIVAYSQQRFALRHREESTMFQLKSKMLEKLFKDTISRRRISLVKQEKDVGVRFFWDGHRGILCVKNQYLETKQFKVTILREKASEIFFEDQSDKTEHKVTILSQKYAIVCFIRRQDHDIGHFYQLKAL